MVIHHAAIWTEKLEELKEFYTKYLGGSVGEKYINSSKQFESYFVSFGGGTSLELMRRAGVPENLNDRAGVQHTGLIHLAFGTGSAEEVDSKAAELREAGIRILSGPRKTGDGYYEFEALDPDNNRIEVIYKL